MQITIKNDLAIAEAIVQKKNSILNLSVESERLLDLAEFISLWETPFTSQVEKNDVINEIISIALKM
jgi:hypothetical protein